MTNLAAAESLSDFANNLKVVLQELDKMQKENNKLKAKIKELESKLEKK